MHKGLPKHLWNNPIKKMELRRITETISRFPDVKMIILFGSYSRGDWVEDVYKEEGTTYEYISDFDILAVVDEDSCDPKEQVLLQYEIEKKVRRIKSVATPVSIIVDSIQHINHQIRRRRSFYVDIAREGFIIYDAREFRIDEDPKPLSLEERKDMAEEHYEMWYGRGKGAIEMYEFALDRKEYNWAVFMLHQATEAFYSAFLLVATGYKPKTHDLETIHQKVITLNPQFNIVFPMKTDEEKVLFGLLRKAYTEARYKKTYSIGEDQLIKIAQQVHMLKHLTTSVCRNEIKSMS